MNIKKLYGMFFALLLLAGVVSAQTTFYVNNLTGNDANSGLSSDQAKATVNSAMIAAPAGSIISVAATGVNYTEAAPVVRGTYTFFSTGGTPIFTNAFNVGVGGWVGAGITGITVAPNSVVTTAAAHGVKNGDVVYIAGTGDAGYDGKYFTASAVTATTFVINSTTGAALGAGGNVAAKGAVTFTAPYEFDGGLNLNIGTLDGGNNVTVKVGVYRTELASILSGALVYSGNVNLNYANLFTAAGATITTGLEWPVALIPNNVNTTATTGAITLKQDATRTMKGVLTTAGAFNLNSLQFNINGNNAHTIGGAVTGTGPLNFTMATAGAASIGGAFAIPNVVVNDDATGATLTINATITNVGTVTVNNSANAAINNNGTVGNILLNGAGNITTSCQVAGVTGTVTMASTSTGNITLNNNAAGSYTTGTITNSGMGTLTWGGNVNAINVGTSGSSTNLVLNTAFTFNNTAATANKGRILVTDVPVVVWGSVKNEVSFSGSSNKAGNNGNGVIVFANTTAPNNITFKNTLLSNVSGSYSFVAPGTGTGNGLITFANTVGDVVFTLAGVTNSSTLSEPNGAGNAAYIKVLAGGTGTLTATNILNSSTYVGADIDFSLLTGAIAGAAAGTPLTITQQGTVAGGQILLGNGTMVTNIGNIVNSRSVAGSDIVIGTGAAVASLSGKNITNSGASNITFNSISGAGTVNLGTFGISQTGTGTTSFPNATGAGTFTFTAFTVSAGTLNFGNGTGAINVSGIVNLTGGTVTFAGAAARTVTFNNATINIGGIGTKPTFGGTSVNLVLAQPIPNVNQTVTLGTLDNTFPGYITVSNTAAIPAPYVFFKSAAGTDTNQPGLLYITNQVLANADGLTFDTGNPAVVNTVQIDNARLYIGKNGAFNGGGFQNTSGYTTANGGFVMMAGGAGIAQPVNAAAIYAGATFGNFGVSNNSGTTPCVTFGAATAVMMGDFYLATGQVNPANLWFGIASAPYSTIYRTEGTFSAPITVGNITSYVNVTYYGGDKTTSNEVPATKLWNLTVATTNGTKPGYGIITMTGGITVSGTLTVNANQTLYTGANGLTLAGSSAVVNGYLVDDGTARVVLGAATGTAITGTGYLPSLIVGNGSVGNTVNGNLGLFAAALGAGVWDGGDDDFTNADGSISYQAGAGDTGSSLTVSFTGNGPHFGNLTMGVAAISTVGLETFTLGSNAVMSGNMTLGGSCLVALGDYTLQHKGTVFTISGANVGIYSQAAITSSATGKLQFVTNATALNATVLPATIAANVDFNAATARTFNLPAYVATTTDNLTINGNVTLSGAGGATVDIGNGNTLTLGGASVTVGTGSSFTAVAGGTTGILNLDVVAPNTTLTYTTPAASSIVNLTVADNVTLAGGVAGSTLTVTNFVHNDGLFTFGTANLGIGAAAAGTFTRNGGTYAGDGWLIYNGAAAGFQHSALVAAGTMVINNLQLTQNVTLQNARQLNVVKSLYLNGGTLTNSVLGGATGYVVMGDVTTVPLVQAVLPATVATNALQFANTNADFTFNGATGAIAANVWPATTTLARNVVVNMAAAANILTIPTRTINGNLTMTRGILQWDSPVVVTIGSGSTITRTNLGFLDWDANANGTTGTLTAANVNLVYTGDVTAAAPSGTGIEYSQPTVVNNFTLGTAAAATTTLNAARSIDGVVSLYAGSVLTVAQNTTFTVAQTITSGTINVAPATKTLTINGNTTLPTTSGNITSNDDFTLRGAHTAGNVTVLKNVTLGTGGSLAATSNLVFGGAANQTITVLAGGSTIGGMTLAQTGTATTVTLVGGNLTTTALTTFTNGIFVTGANTLKLYHPNWNVLPAFPQGFDRSGVTGTNVSHVVGKVAKTTVNAGIVGWVGTSEPRVEFPVGTMTTYRPLVLTFGLSTSGGVPTVPNNTFTVSHTATNPAGQAALPIVGGVKTGVDIARYPSFYWYLMAANSVDPSIRFDLELDPTGFTGFGTNAYDARIIRRHGATTDTANPWLLQGFEAGVDITTRYDNEYNVSTGRFAVINRNSLAGLRADGATFTLGLSTNLATDVVPTNAAAKVATVRGVYTPSLYQNYVLNLEATGAKMFKNNVGTLRYAVTSSNTTLATASVAGTTLTVVPVAVGTANITVTAYDDANNDFMSYTFPVNIGLVGNDKQESAIPTEFAMSQNYPNPFNPTTAIKFAMPKESHVTIKVVNMLGQEVTTLVDEVRPAGYHVVNFNANGLASGHYVAIIKAGEFTKTIKMSLLK